MQELLRHLTIRVTLDYVHAGQIFRLLRCKVCYRNPNWKLAFPAPANVVPVMIVPSFKEMV